MNNHQHTAKKFVVNNGKRRIIHDPTCKHIRHQVEGDWFPVGGPIDDPIYERHRATYATAAELAGKRYDRCAHCCPDLPPSTWTPDGPREIRVASLTPKHVGLYFPDIGGHLARVVVDQEGYHLQAAGQPCRVYPADGVTTYHPHTSH